MAETQRYKLTNKVLMEGYFAEIDDRKFMITRGETKIGFTKDGKQIIKQVPGSVFKDGKPTEKHYLENLSDKQIHELYIAGVIELTNGQKKDYDKFVINFYKK